ncbi:MAG: hypothetical protein AAFR93_05150 [Pseudomonadota bacterium]
MNNYTPALIDARRHLDLALTALQGELQAYPTPVSGCDAQYNHLVGLRRQVADALAALDTPAFVATPRSLHPGAGVEQR